jgi:EAL domain-containing protein (putative c-di-GMP-specific phosphodiesterase class I)
VGAGTLSPADIVEKARCSGVRLALNDVGTGLSLSGVGTPPPEIIDLVRDVRDALVVHLQQKWAIRAWINNSFTPGTPGVCMHCGGRTLDDESLIMIWCGAN